MKRQEEKLKNNFKSLRIRTGLTQEQVSKNLGTSRARFIIHENNPNNFKVGMLLKLAELYNCNVSDFFIGLTETYRLKCNDYYDTIYVKNNNYTNNNNKDKDKDVKYEDDEF